MIQILALDCSTEACSVAVYRVDPARPAGSGEVLVEHHRLAARQHTQLLLPMVETALNEAGVALSQLDACAFGRGPGSFTGLRIALGAIQGLAFGADLPVVAVSSLEALAQSWVDQQAGCGTISGKTPLVVAALDARMDELYWAVYQLDGALVREIGAERLDPPETMREPEQAWTSMRGVGSGWCYRERMPAAWQVPEVCLELTPRASAIARLADRNLRRGEQLAAEQALPRYLRDKVAWQR